MMQSLSLFSPLFLVPVIGLDYNGAIIAVLKECLTMTTLRQLGQSQLFLSPLGLGTWQFSNSNIWQKVNQELVDNILDYCLNHGINWIDTAQIYGESESLIGQSLATLITGKKLEHFPHIATKWWPLMKTAKTIGPTIEQQLERLRIPTIDLYQIHQPFSLSTLEKQIKALADQLHKGNIKNIGVSNFSARQMIKADKLLQEYDLRLVSNQVKYNLLDRRIENNGILDVAKERGIAIIAYSPLQQGVLSGRFHQSPETSDNVGLYRKVFSGINKRNIQKTKPLIDTLTSIGQNYDKTPAQVALNWLIHAHGETVFAIPGASKLTQAQSNLEAQNFKLTQVEIDCLSKVSLEVI